MDYGRCALVDRERECTVLDDKIKQLRDLAERLDRIGVRL
jgi:hypothetical protein